MRHKQATINVSKNGNISDKNKILCNNYNRRLIIVNKKTHKEDDLVCVLKLKVIYYKAPQLFWGHINKK